MYIQLHMYMFLRLYTQSYVSSPIAGPVYTGLIFRVNYQLVRHTLLQLSNFSSSSQTSPTSYNANLQYPSVLGFITQIIQLNSHNKILLLGVNSKLDKNVKFLHHAHYNPHVIWNLLLSDIQCQFSQNGGNPWDYQSHISTELRKTVHYQGRFPLGGIFHTELYFLLSFDAHSPPIGL